VSDDQLPSSCDNLKGQGGIDFKTLQDGATNCTWLLNNGPQKTCLGPGGGVLNCGTQTNAGIGCTNQSTTPPTPSSDCLNDLMNDLQSLGKCWST
jgi:hypothetical protein